jgi:hypothetical protein
MKNRSLNKVQIQANEYLKETDLSQIMVQTKEGDNILIIHLLTDFFKYLKKNKPSKN